MRAKADTAKERAIARAEKEIEDAESPGVEVLASWGVFCVDDVGDVVVLGVSWVIRTT